MGGTESTGRKVSFGLNEEDNVTVLQGIKVNAEIIAFKFKDILAG